MGPLKHPPPTSRPTSRPPANPRPPPKQRKTHRRPPLMRGPLMRRPLMRPPLMRWRPKLQTKGGGGGRRGRRTSGAQARQSIRPPRRLVRDSFVFGVREQGQGESRNEGSLDAPRGHDLRSGHPDGGCGRDQERQEGDGTPEDVPRVHPLPYVSDRRLLVRRSEHAGCHRFRGFGKQAGATLATRGREVPRCEGRGRGQGTTVQAGMGDGRQCPSSSSDRSPISMV